MNLPPPQSEGAADFLQWANHRVANDDNQEEDEEVREALPSPLKAAAKKKKLRRRNAVPSAVDRGFASARDLSYNPHTARRQAVVYALQAVATVLPVLLLPAAPLVPNPRRVLAALGFRTHVEYSPH